MPFNPKELSGLHLWLRADAITGLASFASVATWSDSSDNGVHLTAPAPSVRPQIVANMINGKPSVYFDGDRFLTSAAFAAVTQPRTVFVVCKNLGTSTCSLMDGAAAGGRQSVGYESSQGRLALNGGAAYAGTTPLGSDFHVVACYFDGAASEAFADGVSQGVADAGSHSITGYTVGADYLGGGFEGHIAEVVVYSRRLSASERNQVEDYLAAKYALPVTPYRISATAVSMRGSGETKEFWANQPTTWRTDVPGRVAATDSYNAVYTPPNRTSSCLLKAVNASNQALTATVSVTGKVPYDPSLESEGSARKRFFGSQGDSGKSQYRRKSGKKRFFKLVWRDRTVDPELEEVIEFWRWHHGRPDRPVYYTDPYTQEEALYETDSNLSWDPPSHNQTTYRGALKEK